MDHLPSSIAEVKNEKRYTSTPPIRLHAVEVKFIFAFVFVAYLLVPQVYYKEYNTLSLYFFRYWPRPKVFQVNVSGRVILSTFCLRSNIMYKGHTLTKYNLGYNFTNLTKIKFVGYF